MQQEPPLSGEDQLRNKVKTLELTIETLKKNVADQKAGRQEFQSPLFDMQRRSAEIERTSESKMSELLAIIDRLKSRPLESERPSPDSNAYCRLLAVHEETVARLKECELRASKFPTARAWKCLDC
jgi:septal ring factor EnvC (AmiA/AmiB activator)